MKSKGVAIAMESIIYIILAVLVLTILLYFFMTQAGPAQSEFELRRQSIDLCNQVVQYSNKCQITNVPLELQNKLKDVCKNLKVIDCPTDAQKCIQRCCANVGLCPTPTAATTTTP